MHGGAYVGQMHATSQPPAGPRAAEPDGSALAERLGRAGGAVLALAFGAVGHLRGTRALHPVGVCGSGRLTTRPGRPSGVLLLDDPGPHPCQVRWSRSMGFRGGIDIEGLAVRVEGPAGGDVLVSSTGTGVVGRHVLVLRRHDQHGTLTTLLPVSTDRGPLLLRLDPVVDAEGEIERRDRPEGLPAAYRLLVSAPGRPWHERGRLDLTWDDADCTRRHDPVGNALAGTWMHPFLARVRRPAYTAAQQVAAERREPRGA